VTRIATPAATRNPADLAQTPERLPIHSRSTPPRVAGHGGLEVLVSWAAAGRWFGCVWSEASYADVVVRVRRTAPLSEQDREQAVAALTIMIGQWWAVRGRNAGAHDGSGQHGGAAAGGQR